MDIFCSYEVTGLGSNLAVFMGEVAVHDLMIKPFFNVHFIRRNFLAVTENEFINLMKSRKPDGKRISECLYKLSSGIEHSAHEDRVYDFVMRLVRGFSVREAEIFLKFSTGQEVLCEGTRIGVQFNGVTDGEQMVPRACTCGNIVTLSRYFFSYEHLERLIFQLIDNPSVWNFFSAV